MKKLLFFVLTALLFNCNNPKEQDSKEIFPVLTGKYIDQNEPGLSPELFAPGIVSTGMNELNSLFSPDFNEFYYSIIVNDQFVIIKMLYDGQKWSEPEVAEFSGRYSDADPCFSPDGKWLYFISKRPVNPGDSVKKDWDIWRCEKTDGKWAEAQHLDSIINSEADETYPCFSKQGTLYFSSGRKGTIGNRDIWFAKKSNDYFEIPQRIEGEVNDFWEGDLYISSDEDYLIFVSVGRPEGNGLYISFKDNERWTKPQNMGKEINMSGREYCPIVSPDGKYFFFTSPKKKGLSENTERLTYKRIKEKYRENLKKTQMGGGDIYWLDAKVIETYGQK